MYQRFIYDEMPGAFNVALNTMPDLESYLLNMDDDQIGNPDDPEVKRLQTLMNKTILGAKLWKDLENSTRTVYYFVSEKNSVLTAHNFSIFESCAIYGKVVTLYMTTSTI